MKNEYLTDEELLSLINDVESNGMLTSPKYLKSNIFSEISKQKKHSQLISITTYRVKICLAAAVAILIFCILPFKMPASSEKLLRNCEIRETRVENSISRNELKLERNELIENFIDSIETKIMEE